MSAPGKSNWDHARVVETIRMDRIIAVVRTPTEESARKLIDAYARGGLRLIEVTLTTPGALEIIRDLSGGADLCVGAGTVMSADLAGAVIEAGGKYIIAPHTDPETIRFCKDRSTPVIPGTLTPSEVARAWSLRPDFVKVFPIAAMGGARYLRLFRGPLPDAPIIPTGGVQLDDVEGLFDAGAVAIGVSDGLATAEDVKEGRWDQITGRAKAYLAALQSIPRGN